MNKKIFMALIFMAFLVPGILAYDFVIEIQTIPGAEVTFRALDRVTGKMIDSVNGVFVQNADSNGKVVIEYSYDDIIIKGSIAIVKNNENVMFNQSIYYINKYKTLGINKIDLRLPNNPKYTFESNEVPEPAPATESVPEPAPATESVPEPAPATESVPESSSNITGNILGSVKNFFTSKTTYYVIGFIGVLVILFFVLLIIRKKFSKGGNIKIVKFETHYDKELDEAERRLDLARKELDKLKSRKEKMREAREKLKRDQKELESLEKEYEKRRL